MKRRIIGIMLILIMVLSLLPVPALANVGWDFSETSGVLRIYGSGAMPSFDSTELYNLGGPWARSEYTNYGDDIKTAIISEGFTSIGSWAFYGCPNLTSVTIPGSVTHIGLRAFYGCSSLSAVYIEDLSAWCEISFNSEYVGTTNPLCWAGNLYLNGRLVKNLVIPDDVTSISHDVFSGCNSIETLTIPDSVTSVGEYAFLLCDSLKTVTIGDGVKKIDKQTFYGCSSLTSVTIGSGVKSIREYAFYGCDALTDVYYHGTEKQWNSITKYSYNSALTSAELHYLSENYIDNGNDTHVKYYLCADCGIEHGERRVETCASNDSDNICDLCGGILPCEHGETTEATIYIPDEDSESHNVAIEKTCIRCGESVDVQIIESAVCCTDTDKNLACDLCEQELACKHDGNASIYYTPNDDGKTHNETVNCEICNGVLYTIQENQTCTDEDGFCSVCGQDLSCRHRQTEQTSVYTANGDGKTHTVTVVTTCKSCSGEVSREVTAEAENCTYSDEENLCTLCGQKLLCRHLETENRTVYVDNENRSHKVFTCTVCLECDEEVSRSVLIEAEPCPDENDDDLCDRCEADLYCAHTSGSKLVYTPNGDRATHAVTLNCVVCMEVLNPVVQQETCNFTDGICNKCGADITVISGTCGDDLTWNLNTRTGMLTVSGTGAMADYTDGGAPWYEYREDITNLAIEEGVTSVGTWAFRSCTALETVSISDSVEKIGESAFRACTSLNAVTVPAKVLSIGRSAFGSCDSLSRINVESENAAYCDIDGVLFTKDQKTLVAYPAGHERYEYVIPDGVISIADAAFLYCTNLTAVTLPNSVTGIGEAAFCGCSSLVSAVLPEGLTSLSGNSFYRCTALESIVIPGSVTSIGSKAFDYCEALSDVYYIGEAERADSMSIGSGNAPLTDAQWHYMQRLYTPSGDLVHAFGNICTECGEIVGEVETSSCVDADHDLLCDVCGGSMRIDVKKFAVAGCNMTLGNELELNIMLPKATVDAYGRDLTATVTHHAVSGDVVYEWPVSELPEYSGGKYYKASVRVAAAQMTDLVDIVITDTYGNVYNNDYVTSVRTYVTNNVDKQTAVAKTLLVDMVNYGAAAQDQFKYRQDDYANADLTDSQKALATPAVTCADIRVKGTNYVGSNLSLKDKILLNFFFKKADDAAMAEMYATVEFTGARGNAVKETVAVQKMSGYTGVAVDRIVLADAGCPVTVTVYNADGSVYGYATDSVESYNARQNPDGTNALYTNIMKFSMAACDYFGCMPSADLANVFVYEEVAEVVLADGTVLQGEAYRALGEVEGIVVYETAPESIPLMRCSFVRKLGETADGTVVYKTVGEVTDLPGSYCDYDYGAIGWPDLSEVTVYYEYDPETYDDDSGTYAPTLTAYSSWEDILCKHEFTAALYWKPEDEDYVIVWITDWYDEDWDQIIF